MQNEAVFSEIKKMPSPHRYNFLYLPLQSQYSRAASIQWFLPQGEYVEDLIFIKKIKVFGESPGVPTRTPERKRPSSGMPNGGIKKRGATTNYTPNWFK